MFTNEFRRWLHDDDDAASNRVVVGGGGKVNGAYGPRQGEYALAVAAHHKMENCGGRRRSAMQAAIIRGFCGGVPFWVDGGEAHGRRVCVASSVERAGAAETRACRKQIHLIAQHHSEFKR